MHYVHLPLHGGVTPTQQDIDQAFAILLDGSKFPVFLHCREGKDRAGMIVRLLPHLA